MALPHTQTHQNLNDAQDDLDLNQTLQDVGQDEDAEIYRNSDGAQTGGTRAFNANAGRSTLPNVQGETSARDGGFSTRLIESDEQGVSNHSASEEAARNAKVVNERPDALQGVDQVGKAVR